MKKWVIFTARISVIENEPNFENMCILFRVTILILNLTQIFWKVLFTIRHFFTAFIESFVLHENIKVKVNGTLLAGKMLAPKIGFAFP